MFCISCGGSYMVTNRKTCFPCEKLHNERKELIKDQCKICKSDEVSFGGCNKCRRAEARKKPCTACNGMIDVNNTQLHELCYECNEKAEECFKN